MSDSPKPVLPTDSTERKNLPLATGCLDYFPAALAAVADLSRQGNEKHNPGEPLHHARGKSMDHADCIVRHLIDRGTVDPEDGIRHSVKVAWRALALLQEELEAEGAPMARGARPAPVGKTLAQAFPSGKVTITIDPESLKNADVCTTLNCPICAASRRDREPSQAY